MFGHMHRRWHAKHGHAHHMGGHRGWGRGHGRWGGFEFQWDAEPGEDGPARGRRRMFDGGELRLVLLKLIEEGPRHGYDLIREIEERTGGAYAPSPGVIYPTLTMLDEMGLIEEQQSEGAKKVFGITAAGGAHLTEREEEVEALMARLAQIGAMRERGRGGPVRRAMRNLKMVLGETLGREDVDSELMHEVASILDEAVQKIERLRR